MTIRIARDPHATDAFCWFAIDETNSRNLEHSLLDIEDHDDITEDELIAQARDQGLVGDIIVDMG